MDEIMLACAVAHLLEHIDTGEPMDYGAAMSLIHSSGLAEWAEKNSVLLPLRRDGKPQAGRLKVG